MKVPKYDDAHLFFGGILGTANQLQVMGDGLFDEITMKQWFVLAILEVFKEEAPTLKELAEEVGSSHQNVKQLVLKLQEKGYVEMFQDLEDKRKIRIQSTGKWQQIEVKYQEAEEQMLAQLFNGILEEDLRKAVEVLIKMRENMEEMKSNESKSGSRLSF